MSRTKGGPASGGAFAPADCIKTPASRRQWLRQTGHLLAASSAASLGPRLALANTPDPNAPPPAASAGVAAPQIGQPVPWPTVSLLDGGQRDAAAWQGRAAVVVFFSTTCPFCARHNRHVDRLVEAAAQLPLRVLGVAHDRDPEVVRRYMARDGHRFDVTLAAAPMHAALSQRRVIPLTCVVDRRGLLREVIPGEMFEEDVLELARWAKG